MADLACPKCNGPAVRVEQTGRLSCARQCDETIPDQFERRELEGLAIDLSRLVAQHTPKGYGFTLILARFGDGGQMAYASTVQRAGVVSMLREMADKDRVGEIVVMAVCAFCRAPAEGNDAVHRDGFDVGPEVDLCDACGASEGPTLGTIWSRISTKNPATFQETP